MVRRYEVVSADAHILEPPRLWEKWLPKKHRDKAPKLVKDEEGGDAWLFGGTGQPDPIGLVSTPGRAWKDLKWTGVTYDEIRPGCFDGAERLKDMDEDGVDAEILFAPQRTIGHFLGDEDDEFVKAGVEAYNDFLREEFCAPDRSRLIGLAQIGSLGTERSVKELEAAARRGFKGVVISSWPSAKDAISREDDPFWAAAQDADTTVTNHITMVSRKARIAQRKAAIQAGQSATSGAGHSQSRDLKAKAVGGLGSVFTVVPPNMAQLIMTGVFDRFPKLRFVFVETGAGWIPHFLEQMDDRFWRNRAWAELELRHAPSHYWYRNMAATFIVDRTAILLRHACGVDNILWSADYPHHGNDWPYSQKTIAEMMFDVDPEERRRIVGRNAVRWFRLEEPETGR
ncbi:MAG: amidohydrolase family protein [Candidatus Binatia bacterium]